MRSSITTDIRSCKSLSAGNDNEYFKIERRHFLGDSEVALNFIYMQVVTGMIEYFFAVTREIAYSIVKVLANRF